MYTYVDEDLGVVIFKTNPRAKNIIIKRKYDHLSVTHPKGTRISSVKKIIEREKPKILGLKNQVRKRFTYDTTFSTLTFSVHICRGTTANNYRLVLENQKLNLFIPPDLEVEEEVVQNMIRHLLEGALRREAKRVFPQMVADLSKEFGFHYKMVKINKSRTRWGSCTSDKNINLSYFMLLLPQQIIRTIILHELCHTVELNHGERFWRLLDRCTENNARQLDKQIRRYRNEALTYLFDGKEVDDV